MNVHVLSWNIWCGKYLPTVIKLLKKEKPDVVALQEVVTSPREGNSAEVIAHELGYQWTFVEVSLFPTPTGPIPWGEAVLSRYPIRETKTHELSTEPRHIGLDACLNIKNKELHVVSTHLTHTHQATSEHQQDEARALASAIPFQKTVVLGDFNATPESKTIFIMQESLVKADENDAPTWCVYPDGCATCNLSEVKHRLDYMFTTPDLKVSNYRVLPSDGSDHLPITATIAL